jgi:uncharacterized protein
LFLADPFFYVVAILAVLINGVSKVGFGGGLGVMSVPLLCLVISPRQAAAIMLPLLCLADLFGTTEFWKKWDKKNLKILLPSSLGGVLIGVLSFRLFDASRVQLMIGLLAVVFPLKYWISGGQTGEAKAPGLIRGGVWGAITGFTSFVAHAGSPSANIYLLPQRLDKTVFVATSIILYAFLNYAKLIPYIWLGLFQVDTLKAALVLSPLVPLSTRLGRWLNQRLDSRQFYRISYMLLFVTGIKLMYGGIH